MLVSEKGKTMSYWIVRAKAVGAKAEQFNWLGGSLGAAWRFLLIIIIGAVLGAIIGLLFGIDFAKNPGYTTWVAFVVIVVAVVPVWTISTVTRLLPCPASLLTAAYEDASLPRWVRAYAATQQRDDALARGADAWAVTWEERRANL
jgi:hypothetical protein